jgi:hypothetical protein
MFIAGHHNEGHHNEGTEDNWPKLLSVYRTVEVHTGGFIEHFKTRPARNGNFESPPSRTSSQDHIDVVV